MTGLRNPQDVERILRSTLSEVAGTVTDAGQVTAPVGLGRQRRHRANRWAASLAAAVIVAAIAAATLLKPWPGAHQVTPVTPPTSFSISQPEPRTPKPSVERAPAVRLEWWTTPIPAGYTRETRIVTEHFSAEQLIKKNDPQRNTVGNGGGPAGVLVRRWRPGAFDATTVATSEKVQIGTHAGLFGTTPGGPFDYQVSYAKGTLPTLAMRVATNQWVTFAGTTAQTKRKSELIRVARTVLSASTTSPMTVPFRLSGLPPTLHVLGAREDLDPTHPYGLQIDITDGPLSGSLETVQQTTDLAVQIWKRDTLPTSQTGARITADGRTGKLDTTGQAAYFPIEARLADIEYNGPGATPADLRAVLSRLDWSPNPGNESTWFTATDLTH